MAVRVSNDEESKEIFYTIYVQEALRYGFAFTAWDDGGGMRVYKRKTREREK